ncbi:MAG: hypothetical protein H6744_08295 [Deltaproteobacteria bacterium]|nr:hypothetical protein [Deltaproteobacteria bacterium]
MKLGRLASLVLLAWAALGAGGCVLETTTVTIRRTVEQNALVPAPTGPRTTGPRAKTGRPAVELGYSFNPVSGRGRSHFEGERGDVVVQHMFRMGMTVGVGDFLELGVHGELGNAAFGEPAAADGQSDGIGRRFGRFGPSVRALFPVGPRARLGFVMEAELASIPYRIDVYERAWLTTRTYEAGVDPWWIEQDSRERYLGAREYQRQRSVLLPLFRTGLQLQIDLTSKLGLTLGLVGQNIPIFEGATTESHDCQWTRSPEACAASHPILGPYLKHAAVGTAHLALSLTLGHTILLAQVAAHPFAPEAIRTTTPASFDLGLRHQF